jgi:hypothetical protein
MTEVKTKLCKACNQEKPMSEFYLKQRDDYAQECLGCRLAAASGQSTATTKMHEEQALLEVSMLNAETVGHRFEDVVVDGIGSGIPPEVLTRMKELWEKTKVIGNEVIEVGKILIMKIIEFLKAHPKLAASLAVGAAVYLLSHAIPIIGPLLAPLLAAVSAIYTFGTVSSLDEAIDMAKKFFQLLVDVFNALAKRWALA